MADDVTVTNKKTSFDADTNADYTVATDDVSGKQYQRFKLDLGGDGVSSPLVRGQLTGANSVSVVLASDQTVPMSAASLPLPSGAATSANQTTIIGHVDGIEALLGTVDTDTGNIATNAASIDGKITACNTGAVVVSSSALPSGAATAAKQPALGTAGTASSDVITVQGISGMTAVKTDGSAVTQPVSGTVTAELSATDNAVLDNIDADLTTIIGHVDGLEGLLTTIDADTGNISTKIDTLAGAVSGTEMQADIVAALPAGTNALGKLLPPDIDVTAHSNYARKYYTNAGAVTDGIIWSPAAGKRWHVVTIYINVSAAATVTLEDDKAAGDDPVWKGELAANSGAVLHFPEKYPLASGEDAADLLITTSAGNVYVTCVGYEV